MASIAIYLNIFLSLIFFMNCININLAFDQRPMQDFCVADLSSTQIITKINGIYSCKDPKSVTPDDFYYTLFDKPGNTSNPFKVGFTWVSVKVVPGLNTLGLAMARLDLEPGGVYPLHLHPRASELHIVIQGALEVGFVSPDQGYKYYNKTVKAGEMFVVPPGLIHIQRNAGKGQTTSYSILNSQNPGIDIVTQAVFGASPAMDPNYLASTYQLDAKIVETLQGKTWPV